LIAQHHPATQLLSMGSSSFKKARTFRGSPPNPVKGAEDVISIFAETGR